MKKEIEVLYEDDSVVVVNKPSGIMVHNDGRNDGETIVDWLLKHAPEAFGVGEENFTLEGEKLERSGVVHRLDKDTSGVLILAKTEDAFLHLKTQFHDKLVKKEYRAFVYGNMKEKWGTIDRPIGRSSRDFRLRSAQRGAKGRLRESVTDWEIINQTEKYAYLKVFPKTGRTHQIRVHFKAIGRPVVCDMLYAPKNLLDSESLGFDRLALHSHVLTIELLGGKVYKFIAPMPEEFNIAEVSIAT